MGLRIGSWLPFPRSSHSSKHSPLRLGVDHYTEEELTKILPQSRNLLLPQSPMFGAGASDPRSVDVKPVDLQAMGLAGGGKIIQDILEDTNPANCWNKSQSKLINIHILDPMSCEKVTHVVPLPPPIDAKAYTDAKIPFYTMQEDVDGRLGEGDFEGLKSVSEMDEAVGVTTEAEFDPLKPQMCTECEKRLCDCM